MDGWKGEEQMSVSPMMATRAHIPRRVWCHSRLPGVKKKLFYFFALQILSGSLVLGGGEGMGGGEESGRMEK